jgi:DNA repair protein RecO (recombination protein O)
MDWTDHGIVLAQRRHGESGAIVALLTAEHGRHAGWVRTMQGPRNRGIFVPGNLVLASWRARLDEHLGTLTGELVTPFAARVLDDADRLTVLTAACAMIDLALPEREPHPRAFAALHALMEEALAPDWAASYVRWELDLLAELGFGLDLRSCAITGATDNLRYVSPRTGRAVSDTAAEPWRPKLLALPAFLTDPAVSPSPADLVAGLALTGHFLTLNLFRPHGGDGPAARTRLLERVARVATISGRSKSE